MNLSEWLSVIALLISLGAVIVSIVSIRHSKKSAEAAQDSARTAENTLNFNKEKYENEKKEKRKDFLRKLSDKLRAKGNTISIGLTFLDQYPNLTLEERNEILKMAGVQEKRFPIK